MPFKVTDNETGRIATFENKPTEQDMQEAFGAIETATVTPEQPKPFEPSFLQRSSMGAAGFTPYGEQALKSVFSEEMPEVVEKSPMLAGIYGVTQRFARMGAKLPESAIKLPWNIIKSVASLGALSAKEQYNRFDLMKTAVMNPEQLNAKWQNYVKEGKQLGESFWEGLKPYTSATLYSEQAEKDPIQPVMDIATLVTAGGTIGTKLGLKGSQKFDLLGNISKKLQTTNINETQLAKMSEAEKKILMASYDKTLEPIIQKGFAGTTGFVSKAVQRLKGEMVDKVTAVKAIISNRRNLKLSSEKIIPQTVDDMAEAVHQTKFNLWKEQAKAMGITSESGYKISVQKAINGLDEIIGDRTLIGTKSKIRDAAIKLQDDLKEVEAKGGFTIEEAQKYATDTNVDSINWYKKTHPDFDTDLAMRITVSNELKNEMNRVVDLVTGVDIKGLKAQYKGLLSIEEDINKVRNKVWKQTYGQNTVSYWDLGTDWGLLHSTVTGNVPALISSAGAKAIGIWQRYVKNPNNYVKNMFQKSAKVVEKQERIERTIPKKVKPVLPTEPEAWRK